jgi:hypothetical protein
LLRSNFLSLFVSECLNGSGDGQCFRPLLELFRQINQSI